MSRLLDRFNRTEPDSTGPVNPERVYRERQIARMVPLLQIGLFGEALLFLAFAVSDALILGPAMIPRTLPVRLALVLLQGGLGLALRVPYLAHRPMAVLQFSTVASAVGVALLSERLPQGRALAIASYLLIVLVLAVVVPSLRAMVSLSVALAATTLVVTLGLGLGVVANVTTHVFLLPALAIACALAHARERADRETFRLQRELESEHGRLERLARTDGLTNVHNRRSLLEAGHAALLLARRHARPVSLALLDVDHFKEVNDTHGHPAGDTMLRTLADTCLHVLRVTDCFGRLGGEEFAALLPETDREGALALAERLRAACAEAEVATPKEKLRFTVSIGVACADPEDDMESLLQRADAAMYAAKRAGRDRVRAA